jgi:hypothetical protein
MKKVYVVLAIIGMFIVNGLVGSMVYAMGSKPPEKGVEQSGLDAPDDAKASEEMQQNAEEAKKIVVAKVNGDDISMYNLVRMMNKMASNYVKPGEVISAELTEKVKKEALDRLIYQELAIQYAVKQGITIEPEIIDKVVSRVKEGLGTEEAYQAYLDKFGFNEEIFRKQIERGHRLEKITKREIYGKVQVDPKEIKKEYEKIKKEGKLLMADKYVAKDVLLMQGDDEKATKKRAEELLAKLKENKAQLTEEDKKKGRDEIGLLVLDGTFITRRLKVNKDKNPEIYKKMGKMKIDEMSGIVKDKDSYHIFKVVNNEPARNQTLEEAKGFIENRLRVPAQNKRMAKFEEELKKDANIEILLDQVEKELKEKVEKDKKEG